MFRNTTMTCSLQECFQNTCKKLQALKENCILPLFIMTRGLIHDKEILILTSNLALSRKINRKLEWHTLRKGILTKEMNPGVCFNLVFRKPHPCVYTTEKVNHKVVMATQNQKLKKTPPHPLFWILGTNTKLQLYQTKAHNMINSLMYHISMYGNTWQEEK